MSKRGSLRLSMRVCLAVVVFCLLVAAPNYAESKNTVELKLATHVSTVHRIYTHGIQVWVKNIEKATGGKVKIIPYPSQTLCKGKNTWEAVKGGIADIGHAFVGFFPGRFPVTEVAFLPTMCMDQASNAETSTHVIMDAYHKFPEMQAEYTDVKLLFLNTIQPAFVATKRKAVHKLEDLRGLKLRIAGTYISEFMKAQGAVPMLMPPSAMYENMQKKVIDGYAYSWDGFLSRKMYEVTDYVTDARWYVGAFFTIMNRDVWNSLSPDIQKAIESVSGIDAAILSAKQFDHGTKPALKLCKERNIEVITLSPAEQQKWKQAAKPIWNNWKTKLEAKGVAPKRVQEILDETVKLYTKYAKP